MYLRWVHTAASSRASPPKALARATSWVSLTGINTNLPSSFFRGFRPPAPCTKVIHGAELMAASVWANTLASSSRNCWHDATSGATVPRMSSARLISARAAEAAATAFTLAARTAAKSRNAARLDASHSCGEDRDIVYGFEV